MARDNNDKKQLILEKGLEVIWKKGYHDTSINDIVKAAGIPKGSFYYYFETKEDFSIEALNFYVDMIDCVVHDSLNKISGTPLEKIMQMLDIRISHFTNKDESFSNGCYLFHMCNEMGKANEKIRQSAAKLLIEQQEIIVKMVQDAIDSKEIECDDATELTEFLDYSFNGAMAIYQTTKDKTVFDRYKKIITKLIIPKA